MNRIPVPRLRKVLPRIELRTGDRGACRDDRSIVCGAEPLELDDQDVGTDPGGGLCVEEQTAEIRSFDQENSVRVAAQ